jgi:hypothetical protein
MAPEPPKRLPFGPSKYAAFHLLLSRWLRHYGKAEQYSYITLGGTELRDIHSIHFIDPTLVSPATSYERDRGRHLLTATELEKLQSAGVEVTAVNGDIFSCSRESAACHLFFFDFQGICAWSDYADRFEDLFQREVIREEDAFFLTSYLGRNPGWPRVFDTFSGEFSLLGATDAATRRLWYRRAHPSFTLFRALSHGRLEDEIRLRCLGCVEYKDSSPMGLYGYVVTNGRTNFRDFIIETPYFHIRHGHAGSARTV